MQTDCLVALGFHESVLEVDQGYIFTLQMFQIALNFTPENVSSILCVFYLKRKRGKTNKKLKSTYEHLDTE